MNDQDLMPERLGEYRLLDRIGEGGMGVVFLARDRRHRTVALKVLRSSVAGDPTARRRLAREVETMQRVRSPNVAEVIDADLDGNTPYIVTRFVPGRTLDDVVTQDGPLRGPALSRLACGLADALVAVHAAGVVHRDVKPGNVMLFQDTPVVIDFGIAQGPDATRLTMTGMFMGTPGYLAPEVIEGRPSSEASDVHAWGATVAFAAIGRPPYGTGPYEGIFYRIVNGQADLNEAPAPLLPLLAATLARDPGHRPSAVQLRAQAAVLDPATLVVNHGPTGQAAPGSATAGTATRSDAAAGAVAGAVPGGPAAYVPPAPVASGPAGYVPPTVVAPGAGGPTVLPAPGSPGWPGMVAGNGAGAAAPGTRGPSTRPIAEGRPLPDDLADVLTPVGYAGRGVVPQPGGAAAAPAPASAARQAIAPRPATRMRGQPVMVAAAVVLVASISVLLPVAGTAAALLLIAALRTAGLVQRRSAARRVARGARAMDPVVTTVTLPWFLLRALFAMLILAPFALAAAALAAGIAVVASPGAWPYHALAYAAGTMVLFYGLGPGSGIPRAQLRRFFGTFTKSPATQIVVAFGLAALALSALTAAVSTPAVYWPAVVPVNFIHFGVIHLGPLRRLGYLTHLSGPHRFHLLRGGLLRHFY
ncbi:MAG TPA: serine/threonine-protein kinase [Streptosporangiaceae bacterium]|nr:serine/threonine-protein kinase [Streptosporangiaceae bacterium]